MAVDMGWFKRYWIWLVLLLTLIVASAGYLFWWKKSDVPQYRTTTIEKGRLVASVAATGTLQPVISVQVGSQVSGQLKEVLVDFNSLVKKNQLIARIDPESFEYRVRQAQADLDAARAQVATQQANIAAQRALQSQIEVSLADARRDFERKEQLAEKKFISIAEVDKSRATMNSLAEQVKSAQAQVEVARANAGSAAAVVKQRDAVLAQARVDLERTAIRSPVDGIVIKRSVDKGQTVAASLQAPELFIIAENLTDLRVDTSIDESEVGKIQLGQKATFTVDAFPGRTFEGQVKQIRKSAQVVSNVVTYLVAISTQNSDLKLLPGMTANVRVVTSVQDDVLKVPNSALRFRPPQKSDDKSDKKTERAKSGQKEGSANGSGRSKREPGVAKLYRVENNELKVITVKTGASDGQMTEITGEGVAEGVEVVTGVKGGDTGRGRSSSTTMGNAPRVF
jgi:HlyD family secretion protein